MGKSRGGFEFPNAADPRPFEDVARCQNCGGVLPMTNYYVYKGKAYHRECLPGEARKVATEV